MKNCKKYQDKPRGLVDKLSYVYLVCSREFVWAMLVIPYVYVMHNEILFKLN